MLKLGHSRAMRDTIIYRMMLPYFRNLGPKWLRRWFLDLLPIEPIQRIKGIVDTMDEHTRRIFFEKRAALEAGDIAVKEQVANGKDVMSILCKSFPFTNVING